MAPSALDQLDRLTRDVKSRREIREIPIGDLLPDPNQPRTSLRELGPDETTADLEQLAQSVRTAGIIQPLLIQTEGPGGRFRIVAGERRWRAARIAELRTVPCVLLAEEADEPRRIGYIQLIENIQRKDLALLENAQALRNLISNLDIDQAELAERLGYSKAWISAHLGLLRAEGPAKQALEERLLTTPDAYQRFIKLNSRQQSQLLQEARQTHAPLTRHQLDSLLKRSQRRVASKRATPKETSAERTGPKESRFGSVYAFPPLTHRQACCLFSRLELAPPTSPERFGPTLLAFLDQ